MLLASERVGAHNSAAPHVTVSLPRHPFWLALVSDLVERYDLRCYEPMNTGTMALTAFVNRACAAIATSPTFWFRKDSPSRRR